MEEKKTGLRLGDLVSLSTGTVFGAGIVTLLGVALLMTGASSWLAYVAAVGVGLIVICPYIFLCSTLRINGGNYSFVSAVLGDSWGGIYGMCFTVVGLAMGLFGMSLGTYVQCIFPGLNVRVFAMCAVTVFFVLNLFGVDVMAKIEKIMFYALMIGLFIYIAMGLTHMTPETMTIHDPNFFSGGTAGFLSAVTLLMFSTTGQSYVVSFSREAENAKRDIPKAILIATGIMLVVYFLVGFVTCNILPVDQVAGQNLAIVARELMPSWLYYAFIIGGPIMALFTTMNSSFVIFSRPMETMVNDGFFPKGLGRTNKAGVPYILVFVVYVIGMIPLVFNFSLSNIVDNTILVESIAEVLACVAVFRFPEKIPGAWDNRYYKYSKGFFRGCVILALITRFCLIGMTLTTLTPAIAITTLACVGIFVVYTNLRVRGNNVHVIKSYELQ